MTPDQFVTAWMQLLDKGHSVIFSDDMRLYECRISVYFDETDEWAEYKAACDINVPNPVKLFAEAYANMQADKREEDGA